MRVGLGTAITVNLILLASWSGTSIANILHDIPKSNPLNIDWDPAPSPEDGPPLSAGALRNSAYLPAQVGGIVGAYFFSVCLIGLGILLVKKLRQRFDQSAKTLDIEMVEPRAQLHYNGSSAFNSGYPASPRNFSWPSPDNSKNPYIFPTTAGHKSQDSFIDKRIVEADQEMLQRDLEDIYAHVMEQEEAKAAGVKVAEMPPPAPLQNASPPMPTDRSSTVSKKIEKRPSTLNVEEAKSRHSSRASSIMSSLKSPKRKGLRGLMISSPVPTPLSAGFPSPGYASDEEPLSPRYYEPPPPPPVPKDQVPYALNRKVSQGSQISATRTIAEQISPYKHQQQFHRPQASQSSMLSIDPGLRNSATSQTPLYKSPSPHQPSYPSKSNLTVNVAPSNNSSTRQLPLRQFEPAMQSPSFKSTTKTTVLERANPLSPGLTTGGGPKTPWTAGAVPYSPYQPFTPMMPITPRLVTKQDRKMMKKMEGRAPTLEMIKDENDLFDSAY